MATAPSHDLVGSSVLPPVLAEDTEAVASPLGPEGTMSHQRSLSGLFRSDNTDITIAKIGLILSALLFSLRLLAEQVLLVVIPVAGGSACALYLVTRRREAKHVELFALRNELVGYLPAVVFFGLAGLVAAIRLTGGRSPSTHLLTGVIGGCIIAQIFLLEDDLLDPRLVLGQIAAAALIVRFSALFGTPGYTGIDIWTHASDFVVGIVDTGTLSAIADTKYVMAPIYHLNGAAGSLVFGSPRAGVFLSIGTLLAVSFLFIYTTSRLLLPARWALLATALFAFSDQVLRWSIHLIPTSLGLVFFLAMLYCLTKIYYSADVRTLSLVFVTALAVVFTHQVSTAIVLLVLGVAAAVSVFAALGQSRPLSEGERLRAIGLSGVFATTTGVTLVSWANTPFSGDFVFLWRMLDVAERTFFSQAGFLNLASTGGDTAAATGGQSGLVGELVPFIEWFGFAVLLAATVIGGITLLRRVDSSELKLTYLLSFGGMFFVVYGLSLFGIRTFLPGRWLAFLHAPMVIMGAFGLYYVAQNASPRVVMAVVLVVALGYPVTMATAEKATLDAPAFEEEYPRFAHTESEIGAVDTISEYRSPAVEADIGTDHPYRALYERVGGYDIPDMQVEEGRPVTPETTVAREYQTEGPATIFVAGDPPVSVDSNDHLSESLCRPEADHLYASDTVTLCVSTGEEGSA